MTADVLAGSLGGLDDQMTKGVRMKPGAVPGVDPVGDDVLGSGGVRSFV